MEFASMGLEDGYSRERNGTLENLRAHLSFPPVWLQHLFAKSRLWLKGHQVPGPAYWNLSGFSYCQVTLKAIARTMKDVFATTPGQHQQERPQPYFSRQQSSYTQNKDFQKNNFQRINFLNKKKLEETFLAPPANCPPFPLSLQENGLFSGNNKSSLFWEEAEQLAQTGFWEFDVPSRNFHCTGNALKLANKTADKAGMDFASFIASFREADQSQLIRHWHLLLHQGQEFAYEASFPGQEGEKWIKIKAKALLKNAAIVKVVGFLQDITEAKLLELSLTAARENAEQDLQAKSDFVSVVTHEIRTPLNAISGFTYLLLQEEVEREEQKEYLRSIQFSAQNLLALINKTLDYSKIEAGKVELEHISFQFHDLLADIHRSFYLRATEKKVNLYLDIHPETPNVAVGDPAKLCQILNNLISNAIKFTQEGHIKISVDVVYESETDWVIEMAVSDTGVGIPPEKQPLIFESFIQANASTNRQFGGTGLGLAITKKLVELQNGSIQLHSVPGEGSEFIVRLKLAKPDPAHLNLHHTDVHLHHYSGLQGARILVVDDNALNRNVACKLLTNWQVQVETADNGLEALQMVKSSSYDVILMDLFMPVMDGFEAIRQIKSFDVKTPIIALTGSALTEEENKVMELGVQDYVTKPFNPQELYKTILEHLILTAI